MKQHSKYRIKQQRSAFTMIELVLVIVVIGILAALSITRMDRDLRQEAADNILSDIRYTQHLALTDDKHRFNQARWERAYWHLAFGTCTGTDKYYRVGSNRDFSAPGGSQFFARNEAAIDPVNTRPMFWTNATPCPNGDPAQTVSDRIFITDKYGITNVTATGGCAGPLHIAFDHYGRPHHGAGFSNSARPVLTGYMPQDCTFTFSFGPGSNMAPFSIQINRETGYAWIVGQDNS